MEKNMRLHNLWLLSLLFLSLFYSLSLYASKVSKGYIDTESVRLKSSTSGSVTTTKGYIGNQRVRLKSDGATIKGYIDSRPVRIKVQKAQESTAIKRDQ